MASMKMSGCMAVVSRMSQSDQDALLARLDQYQADGVPAERAQFMAANDMLEELRAERTQLFGAIAEQHPDLLSVAEKPAARMSRQRQTDTPAFKAWFGDSQVVDADGKPLMVYRGEHGRTDSGDVQTVLGSYTFVDDPDVANAYAETPNDSRMTAEQSRVVPAYLRIENPIIDNRDDPFVEFSDIAQKLGAKEAVRFAQQHAGHIENTNNWEENFSRKYLSVEDLLNKKPKAVNRLYMDAYPLLDDKEFVAAAKAAGFDGAIHVGNGESMDAVEYRVFDKNQIKSAIGNNGAFDRSNPDIRFSRARIGTWFSGARTLEAAVDNVDSVMAVEYDKAINEFANTAHGTAFVTRGIGDVDVQEVRDADVTLFHASPVCKNFSAAKTLKGATDLDRESAGAVAKVIREVSPPVVTVENVPEYATTALFKEITDALDARGYTWDVVIHDAADYGAAQTRKRMLLRAVKTGELPSLPEKIGPADWFNELSDLIGAAPEGTIPPEERRRLDNMIARGDLDPAKPIITMGGSGFARTWAASNAGGPAPTLKAAKEKPKIILPSGEVKAVTPRMMARLMGLPDEFPVPESSRFAKMVLGNGIHGNVTRSLIAPLLRHEAKFSRRRNIYGQQVLSTWTAPTDSKMDDLIYKLQDKQVDTKRVVEAVKAATGNIADKWNPYLQEELYHGRTAKQTADFLNDELRPLMESMQARGVSMDEFEEFLHNRHAEERNDQIARINPNMPDGGSGIDTADARAYLAGLDPAKRRAFDALARRIDAITKGTRDLLVSSGLETQDTIDKWENTYSQYVPLNREDLDFSTTGSGSGTGQGYSVRGSSSKRATGSSRPVVDILANIAMQRERAIVRSQKNRVATALYGLAVTQPNTDFWLAVNPDAIKDPVKLQQELVGMGLNPLDAQKLIDEPKQTYIDPRTGLVAQRVNAALRSNDNVLAVRIGGEDRYVFFNANDERSQRMVQALKNLDAEQLGWVATQASMVTRYIASVNTQYNPVFGAINFLRDTQGAALNLSTTPIADRKTRVMLDAGPALLGIYASLRSRRKGASPATGNWATLWEEFQKEGGQTGFRDMFRKSEERAVALQRMLDPSSWADSPLGKVFTVNGALKVPMEVARKQAAPLFDWLSDYNETMENAVRLSAYKAAKDKGLSNQQAASIAKNLTVNFNRKGQVATQAGAWYAFFNAAVQGTTRLVETLRGPAGKKIMAGGLLLGSAQALLLAAAGFDDDEPPDFVRERNLVIPIGGSKYLSIPLPLGFHVIPNTSRVLTEWALSGWRDPAKRVGQITGAFMDAFNPIGNSGWSAQTITPTPVDPIVALGENRDWTGKPIAKGDMSGLDPTPGYTRAKDTASWFSKELSYFLNLATGGTKYKPGALSPTPDQIDYLIGQATGGVGRELLKVEQTVTSLATGEELPPYKVPLVGRVVGDTQSGSAEANRFYNNVTRLNEHENEIKGRRKNRENAAEYIEENPEARLVNLANHVERDVQKLRQRKREMLERGASKESIRIIETQIANRMKRLNDRVKQLQEAAP